MAVPCGNVLDADVWLPRPNANSLNVTGAICTGLRSLSWIEGQFEAQSANRSSKQLSAPEMYGPMPRLGSLVARPGPSGPRRAAPGACCPRLCAHTPPPAAGTNVSVVGVLITGQHASAVRVEEGDSSRVSVKNCSLFRNVAERGAGFFIKGGKISVTSSHVIGNNATARGAGFYIEGGCVRLALVLLAENHAVEAGGAICVIGGDVALSRVNVYATALLQSEHGDALYLRQPTQGKLAIRLDSVTFRPAPNRTLDMQTVWLNGVAERSFDCNKYNCTPGNSCNYTDYSIWACTPCRKYEYSDDGRTCKRCNPGHQPNSHRTACDACTGRNYSEFGVCEVCEAPATLDGNRTSCKPPACGPGTYCAKGMQCTKASDCKGCYPGSWSEGTKCKPCTGDGNVANAAQSACQGCGPGTEPAANRTICTPCGTGNVSQFGFKCEPCRKGYTAPEGSTICLKMLESDLEE